MMKMETKGALLITVFAIPCSEYAVVIREYPFHHGLSAFNEMVRLDLIKGNDER